MKTSHLVPLSTTETDDGFVKISSQIRMKGKSTQDFSFELPAELYDARMESHANHHLLAMLMPAMRIGGKLIIEGAIDPVLLKNLDQFLHYWTRWCPERLKMIEIEAAEYQPGPRAEFPAMISAFSGGVDSMYSCLRAEKDLGVPLKSLLFLQGFDMEMKHRERAQRVEARYRSWAEARQVPANVISLFTNAREMAEKFQLGWGRMAHGIYIASCMHLFSHQHSMGCIASSDSPSTLIYPWGSNPVSDPLLSTSALSMRHHDVMISRFEKIREIVNHPDCCRMLRVCYQNGNQNTNCGRCGKCMRTLAAMHVAEPDSWREVFPSVKRFDDVLSGMRCLQMSRWMIEQLDYLRDFSWRNRDSSLAGELDALIALKNRELSKFKNPLRRLFYDAKVRLYGRYPSLVKKS